MLDRWAIQRRFGEVGSIVSMEPLLRCLGCQNREKNSFVPARSEKRLIPEPYSYGFLQVRLCSSGLIRFHHSRKFFFFGIRAFEAPELHAQPRHSELMFDELDCPSAAASMKNRTSTMPS
jgi:hypothetical protein